MTEDEKDQEPADELDGLDAASEEEEEQEQAGDGEGLDPLAEEMLRMMEEEGGGSDESDASSQEDVDRMMEMEMLKAMEEQGGLGGSSLTPAVGSAGGGQGGGLPPNIARLMDVSMVVSIVLGRTEKTLEQVMDLTEQSLVELDKTVGDPIDVMVNNRLFARGEVVVVSESFGVRITELVSTPGQVL